MPRVTQFSPDLQRLIKLQHRIITTAQLAAHGVGPGCVKHRVGVGDWQRPLPGVVLTCSGAMTRNQRLIAAQLWAGDKAAIDAACAAYHYGLTVGHFDVSQVYIAAPFESATRTRDWVHVRRSIVDIDFVRRGLVNVVRRDTAVLVAARNARTKREAIATLSRALQTGLVTVASLQAARELLGDKWCRNLDGAMSAIGVGLRSPAEYDLHRLIGSSRILPEPRWNQWLDLGDGGSPVCADCLWESAGIVHEVNGKEYHAWGEAFDDTSARRQRLIAAGLVATDSTPMRLRHAGAVVLANLERTFAENDGRGMPSRVRLLDDCGFRRF